MPTFGSVRSQKYVPALTICSKKRLSNIYIFHQLNITQPYLCKRLPYGHPDQLSIWYPHSLLPFLFDVRGLFWYFERYVRCQVFLWCSDSVEKINKNLRVCTHGKLMRSPRISVSLAQMALMNVRFECLNIDTCVMFLHVPNVWFRIAWYARMSFDPHF